MQCSSTRTSKQLLNRVRTTVGPNANTLSEVFPAAATDACAIGFVLSGLTDTKSPILWVQDRLSNKETGRPYLAGIASKQPIICVNVSRPVDVLWAMEEGLRCKTLAAVIGEIWGSLPALSFTATKRLALRSEANKVPCWLVRHAANPDLSAARDRWNLTSLPSMPHAHDPQAPGQPQWQAELFRSRQSKPGKWVATYDRTANRVDLSAVLRDGPLAEGDGTDRQRAAR